MTASSHLRRLRDHGLLEQQGKGNKTYYIPRKRFLDSLPNNDDNNGDNTQAPSTQSPLVPKLSEKADHASNLLKDKKKRSKPQGLIPKSNVELVPKLESLIPNLDTLSADFRKRIENLGQRTSPAVLDDLIEDLCRWQPLNRLQLSSLIGKGPDHIRNCLRRMLHANRLTMLNPEQPNHPDQKYVTVERGDR